MKINSIEIQDVCPNSDRINGFSKMSWRKGVHKPSVGINDKVMEIPAVVKTVTDYRKLYSDPTQHLLVTVRTTSGIFANFILGESEVSK